MADETALEDHLATLADAGRQHAVPLAAERIRARGEMRTRRRRAALASGGTLLAAALAVTGLSLTWADRGHEPPAALPAPTAALFVPPEPAAGEEYAGELGYVYGAVAEGDTVRVTVEQLRTVRGTAAPTGMVHTLSLPRGLLVEARRLSGGKPADMELGGLVDRLADGPRWVFAIDYDSEGRVHSLREAYWLAD